MQYVAVDQPANHLINQGIDQIIEVINQDGRTAAIQINILQAGTIDAIAYANGGDIDVVEIDEAIPGSRRRVAQRIATRASLLIGVAIADEEDLIAPARNRGVSSHGFINASSKVRLPVKRTGTSVCRIEAVEQSRE